MKRKEIIEPVLFALPCVAAFFGAICLVDLQDMEEPEPPQAAQYRALMDAQQQQREFAQWREQEIRINDQQISALFAADSQNKKY